MTRKEVHHKALKLGVFNSPAFQYDFMPHYQDGQKYGYSESKRYFFTHIHLFGAVELRFWIDSKRVSMTRNENKFNSYDNL